MDTKLLRSLTESYYEIYENQVEEDEMIAEDPIQDYRDMKRSKENASGMRGPELSHSALGASGSGGSAKQKVSKPEPRSREFSHGGGPKSSAQPRSREFAHEEVDAYDIVLSHLLDEGLAGSVEDAETIMGAMSAEWIQGIVEQDLTARQRYLMKKVADMNAEDPGSAHKYTPGKQGAGAALDRANRSAMQMRGV